MPQQFRIVTLGNPRAPWRDTEAEAMNDAIGLDLASYDRAKRQWFLAVPVEVARQGQPDVPPLRRPRLRAPWTPADIDILRELAKKPVHPFVAEDTLGRPVRAIRRKATELGIDLMLGEQKAEAKNRPSW